MLPLGQESREARGVRQDRRPGGPGERRALHRARPAVEDLRGGTESAHRSRRVREPRQGDRLARQPRVPGSAARAGRRRGARPAHRRGGVMTRFVALACCLLACGPALAQQGQVADRVVNIGLLLDMNSLYADLTGEGSAAAARMAIEDFGGKVLGAPIELVYVDHQNKPDIAAAKAREWFDTDRVDIIADVAASATALAAQEVARQKNRIIMFNGPGATRLTNENCTPVSVHYTYDTYARATGTGRGALKTGGDTWFFLTADYAFGHTLEKDTTEIVKAGGGRVLGSVRHPLNAGDVSSFLLQAQSSKAKV